MAGSSSTRISTDNLVARPVDVITGRRDTLLATFPVSALSPNEVETVVVPFTISAKQALGNYFVGVQLDTANVAGEHSEVNNSNPFQVGDHGNASMAVN